MQRHTVQNIGWYGVIAILLAYGLLIFGVLNMDSIWYLMLNLTGATAVAVEARSKKDRQPMVLNVIWALVAVVAIIRLLII
jgi:hypothetical protein